MEVGSASPRPDMCDGVLDYRWHPLLDWLPDETLFSLCSRQHRLWGYPESGTTTRMLFGDPGLGTSHDFPKGLGNFEERTGGMLGNARQLALNRTLLSFCRVFLPAPELEAAATIQRGDSAMHVKRRLKLLADGMRGDHPLKACADCLEEDLARWGWRYWHRIHQIPGVWSCKKHGKRLLTFGGRTLWKNRTEWALPASAALVDVSSHCDSGSMAAVERLSRLILALTHEDLPSGFLWAPHAKPVLASRLAQRGWELGGYMFLDRAAVADFIRHCKSFAAIPELAVLSKRDNWAEMLFERLAYQRVPNVHPLRLLAMIDWLFDSAEDFIETRRSLEFESDLYAQAQAVRHG